MTFTPLLPIGGYAGWAFLQRTKAVQETAFVKQASIVRDETYYREKIGTIDTAEQLVSDKRLLRITLQAFGLEADVNNTFFVRKVLEGSVLDTKALANRLADKRYGALSNAFGFGDFAVPRNKISTFADGILSSWKARTFEVAVGQQSEPIRLAMNAERELVALATSTMSEDSKWFTLMGQTPLRTVFETAFGLPKAFGALDIDKQLEVLKDKARQFAGDDTVGQFNEPANLQKLIRIYLVRSELSGASTTSVSGSAALQLLQSFNRR
ncbi:MAG: DUF1217 domain-containing protein [Gemmobacter sp.]|nr:DUF1217 domain-containing protein [Gemmobacter sp.]